MKLVATFQLVVATAMLSLWAILLIAGQVPEVEQGRTDIWFHVGAEVVTAGLLMMAGIALLRSTSPSGPTDRSKLLSAFALGALLYTTINSPGYYAELGEWPAVALFGLLTIATIVGIARLLSTRSPRRRPQRRTQPAHRSLRASTAGTLDPPSDDPPDLPGRRGVRPAKRPLDRRSH